MSHRSIHRVLMLAGAVACVLPTVAHAQAWANWGIPTCGSLVEGSLGSTHVGYSGGFNAVQGSAGEDYCNGISQTGGQGNNYWTRNGVDPSGAYAVTPSNLSFIQLVGAASGMITFSSAVTNPYLALISVGQPGVETRLTFSDPFSIVSRNDSPANLAYWDTNPDVVSYIDGSTLVSREFSGLIQFHGTFTRISLSTTGENWHGFTVGVPSQVPEPASLALLALGLTGGVIATRRRRPS